MLTANKMEGCGFSDTAHCEHLPQKTKVTWYYYWTVATRQRD